MTFKNAEQNLQKNLDVKRRRMYFTVYISYYFMFSVGMLGGIVLLTRLFKKPFISLISLCFSVGTL